MDLDRLIASSLKKEADEIATPSKDEVWSLIAGQMEKDRLSSRRNRWLRKLAVASAVLAVSLSAVSAMLPGEVSAVGQRLVQIYLGVFEGNIRVDTISRENLPPPLPPDAPSAPPEDQPPVKVFKSPPPKVFKTVEEARKVVPYAFRVPKYIPEGYELMDVTYSTFENESGEVALRYKSARGEYAVRELEMAGQFASGSLFAKDATVKIVEVNGAKGTLLITENGFAELEYYANGIVFRVHGIMDVEEIMKIGKSLS